MKFTQAQRNHLKQLVQDCMIYGLSEHESLEYIQHRFGQPISSSHLYRIKSELQSDDESRKWLNHFAKVGFVEFHRTRLDEMERVQQLCFRMLLDVMQQQQQQQREEKSRRLDRYLALAVVDRIRANNKRLSQLAAGSPVLAQTKAALGAGIDAAAGTGGLVSSNNSR